MHHLGLSHSPFQHRGQFSSPSSAGTVAGSFSFSSGTAGGGGGFGSPISNSYSQQSGRTLEEEDGLDDEDEEDTVGEDRRETREELIHRLKELARRLERDENLGEGVAQRILGSVEGIERVVGEEEQRRVKRGSGHGRVRLDEVERWERESYFGESPSPPGIRRVTGRGNRGLRLGRESNASTTYQPEEIEVEVTKEKDHEILPSKAAEIANAAEELAESLGATIQELMARKEESDHIHDLLVLRAEQASERILFLEYRIAEMEDDFSANQSELKFLRIQLQALETQCSPFLPQHVDHELSESIMNWKIDWEDINRRSRARRKGGSRLSLPLPMESEAARLGRQQSEEVRLGGNV